MADSQTDNAMIQIATASNPIAVNSKPGADSSGSAEALSASAGLPFLALFAQAMAAPETAAGNDAGPLLAALSGDKDSIASAKEHAGADALTPDQTTDDDGLAWLQALLPPAMTVDRYRPPVEATEANPSQLAANDLPGQGKKLPYPLAAIAGRQDGQPIATPVDLPAHPPSETAGPSLNDLSAMPLLDQTPTKASDKLAASGQSPSSPLMISQESLAFAAQGSVSAPNVADRPMAIDMRASFGSPGWQQELGDKVVWMASNQGQFSQLILNPPNLGTVEVRLHLNGGEAGAQFFSANAEVRQALEAALPKLREMMAGVGITLGETTVGNQPFNQREAFQPSSRSTAIASQDESGPSAISSTGSPVSPANRAMRSLLDYYA